MRTALILSVALLIAQIPLGLGAQDDRTGPIVTWNAPRSGSCWQIGGSETNLLLEISAEDASGVKQGIIWMKAGHHGWTSDRSTWSQIWGHTYASGGSAPAAIREIISVLMAGRAEGEYTFLAEFADMAHHNIDTAMLHVSVDFAAPTIAIASPGEGRMVCRDRNLTVNVDADDTGCGIAQLQLYLNAVTAATPLTIDTAPPWQLVVPKAYLRVASLRIIVKAIDRAGRSSQAEVTVRPIMICTVRATR